MLSERDIKLSEQFNCLVQTSYKLCKQDIKSSERDIKLSEQVNYIVRTR